VIFQVPEFSIKIQDFPGGLETLLEDQNAHFTNHAINQINQSINDQWHLQ